MPSPFPGMDPYLEDPAIGSGVHAAFLAGLFERLGPSARPKYAVLDAVVERGSYDLDADYSREPVPPLTPRRAEWAARLIGGAKG